MGKNRRLLPAEDEEELITSVAGLNVRNQLATTLAPRLAEAGTCGDPGRRLRSELTSEAASVRLELATLCFASLARCSGAVADVAIHGEGILAGRWVS